MSDDHETATPTARIPLANLLRSLDACPQAVAWAEPYGLDYERAWQECQRGDWMIWILGQLDTPDAVLRLIACDCARAVLSIYEAAHPGDTRPRRAIDTAERFALGRATHEELAAARDAAWAAARAADRAAAWAAARAADRAAARAADRAAWAADRAAARDAAWAAARAADRAAARAADRAAARAAAWDAAWDAARAAQADFVRARTAGLTIGRRP